MPNMMEVGEQFLPMRRYASMVFATATWLGGWLGGCHTSIASEWLNLS